MIFIMNNNNKSTSTISSVKSKDNNSDETITKNTCVEEDGPRHIHACEIEVTFPTNLQAEQALQILRVDKEPTERVLKSFHLVKEKLPEKGGEGKRILDNNKTSNDTDHKVIHKMKVRFESRELKMLRVSVSSFYDYVTVVLKTLQEFDR